FTDLGWVGKRGDAVAGLPYSGPVASIGMGVRWIPIPFARAVARIDVAMGVYPETRPDVSLGGQQFF
ncbi:MAG TPA: hypothetical protein VG496_20145, partial [Myxococcales bacterium]|nr:hypothetical protein [Myxococcales bacterium]